MSNQYIPDGYKPPINITEEYTNPIIQEHDNQIMSQIKMVVDVDKQELIKALNYDRNQYQCGYQAAVRKYVKHGHWNYSRRGGHQCSCCNRSSKNGSPFCQWCGAIMDEIEVENEV